MMQRKSVTPPRGAGGNSAPQPEAIARAKGGTAAAGKSNLTGQIIPVYGFGILLYILYIIFKITSRGKTSKSQESRFPAERSENTKRKITDFELTQLQERLKETEEMMERIVSRARAQNGNTPREECVSMDQEEMLLLQLREITRVMQEGRLVDVIPSETETQEPACDQEFTDDPEEMLKHWSSHCCTVHHQMDDKETERADRRVDDEETGRADRRVDDEETERADRRVDDDTGRADRRVDDEETERADRRVDDDTGRADRRVDDEETGRADRRVDDDTGRADRRVDDEETGRADRRVDDEETGRADRRVDDEETGRADRRVDDEETGRADRRVDDEETGRADRRVDDEETGRADRRVDDEETGRADRGVDDEETGRADRWVDDEETGRADRQADGCERNECSDEGGDEDEEMMEQSEDQHWNTSLSGSLVIRRRSRRGTTRGTESSH